MRRTEETTQHNAPGFLTRCSAEQFTLNYLILTLSTAGEELQQQQTLDVTSRPHHYARVSIAILSREDAPLISSHVLEIRHRSPFTLLSLSPAIACTYSYWHYALTAENKHTDVVQQDCEPRGSCGRRGRRNTADPAVVKTKKKKERKKKKKNLPGVGSHLLGVGPVPEDGVAVGHHFGTGLLAKYTHQQHQAEEDDHFHLQHHYSETSARYSSSSGSGQSDELLTGASARTGDGGGVSLTCGRARLAQLANAGQTQMRTTRRTART